MYNKKKLHSVLQNCCGNYDYVYLLKFRVVYSDKIRH